MQLPLQFYFGAQYGFFRSSVAYNFNHVPAVGICILSKDNIPLAIKKDNNVKQILLLETLWKEG